MTSHGEAKQSPDNPGMILPIHDDSITISWAHEISTLTSHVRGDVEIFTFSKRVCLIAGIHSKWQIYLFPNFNMIA
jgi:hypothetical protein